MNEENWEKYTRIIEKRVDNLVENKFYYEAMLLLTNIVETELKDLIEYYKKNYTVILTAEGLSCALDKKSNNLEKITLGNAIEESKYFLKEKTINKLLEFNQLRNKIVHKLFSINLEQTEKEIEKYIPKFFNLMLTLVEENLSLSKSFLKYLQRKKRMVHN